MRWKAKKKPTPADGETRYVTKFLFFPLTLNGETRWLEIASLCERFDYGYARYPDVRGIEPNPVKYAAYGKWVKISWVF